MTGSRFTRTPAARSPSANWAIGSFSIAAVVAIIIPNQAKRSDHKDTCPFGGLGAVRVLRRGGPLAKDLPSCLHAVPPSGRYGKSGMRTRQRHRKRSRPHYVLAIKSRIRSHRSLNLYGFRRKRPPVGNASGRAADPIITWSHGHLWRAREASSRPFIGPGMLMSVNKASTPLLLRQSIWSASSAWAASKTSKPSSVRISTTTVRSSSSSSATMIRGA
jgi:hypothetical protein